MKSRSYFFITLALSLLLILIPVIFYNSISDTIPIHFNFLGEIDGYGSKQHLWIISVIAILSNISIIISAQYPDKLNYNVPINDKNKAINYEIMRQFLFIISISSSVFFMAIILCLVFLGMGYKSDLIGISLIGILMLSMISPIIYYRRVGGFVE
jgi:uncharacterized membrane protein